MTALPSESGGNRAVGAIRVVAAVAVAAYVLAFSAFADRTASAQTSRLALGLCGCLAVSGIGQAAAKFGVTRRSTSMVLAADLGLFLGLAALYAFDSHEDLYVLMFLFVIEAGLTLGMRGAVAGWGLAVLGYAGVGYLSASTEIPVDVPVTLLWFGVLLVVAGIAGVLSAEAARRERTGAALRNSERKLRAIVDHAPAAIFVLDTAWIVVSWNPAAVSMFGWTEAEAVGRPLPIVPSDRADDLAYVRAELDAGRMWMGSS